MNSKKDYIILFLLSALAIFLRWYPISGGFFTFEYDMAKDSLIMLEMYQYFDPSLVGAITSIPGLFNGPLWYYIAFAPNILFGFHPFGSIIAVWVLVIFNLFLLKKFTNNFTTFLFAISSGLIGAQQNGWIPYLTTHITVSLLLLLFQLKNKKNLSFKYYFLLGLVVSFYFHSQAAFGVVLVVLMPVIFFVQKVRPTVKQIAVSLLGFFSSLSPLIVFELKNNFIQTRAVLSFITDFGNQAGVIEPNRTGFGRVIEVGTEMITIAGQAISPLAYGLPFGVIALAALVFYSKEKKNLTQAKIYVTLIIGTFFLYLILPVKAYYLVALMPAWILLIGDFVNQNYKKYLSVVYVVLLVLALGRLQQGRSIYAQLDQESTSLYNAKEQAVEKAFELAGGQPFRSYQFVPQIYDYTYQHIFLQKNYNGSYLPTEFSYAAGETTYNTYKHIDPNEPETNLVLLIVEEYVYENVYDEWWNRVSSNLVIEEEVQINDAIKVIKARDETFENTSK